MIKPIAVLISDVHYSLSTLEVADTAFRAAIDKAAELGVPLIDCGDLTNDKAILRAEVVNQLLKTMDYALDKDVQITLLVGNHSLLNEKGTEHALNFLADYANVVSSNTAFERYHFIPYQSSNEEFVKILHKLPKDRIVIAHQGFKGANMGDYIQDRSSVDPKDCEGYRIISGHYHRHQTLGEITYVGNPYTLSFGEANDGPKGYLVLYSDGSFKREYLDLRRHKIETWTIEGYNETHPLKLDPSHVLWVKLTGPKSELDKLTKEAIGDKIVGHNNFRLDLIPTDEVKLDTKEIPMTDPQLLDAIIDNLPESTEYKNSLKQLWRQIDDIT